VLALASIGVMLASFLHLGVTSLPRACGRPIGFGRCGSSSSASFNGSWQDSPSFLTFFRSSPKLGFELCVAPDEIGGGPNRLFFGGQFHEISLIHLT
jgi:hypothetical protein